MRESFKKTSLVPEIYNSDMKMKEQKPDEKHEMVREGAKRNENRFERIFSDKKRKISEYSDRNYGDSERVPPILLTK